MKDEPTLESEYFPTDCNANIKLLDNCKVEIKFPKGGFLRPGKNEFKDQRSLDAYVAHIFPSERTDKGFYGSIKRIGKYRRINDNDEPVFTFGDPIIDLITDENGFIKISGKTIDMRKSELLGQRNGGISTIDLSLFAEDIARYYIMEASQDRKGISIIESNENRLIAASTRGFNAVRITIHESNSTNMMRFQAFKKRGIFNWKMGSYIETWGRDFTSAKIASQYGRVSGTICEEEKIDCDKDTDDNYMDEYEWGWRGFPYQGFSSNCDAKWGGRDYSGTVGIGCPNGFDRFFICL